ncbi:MAG: glycosyltransferase family 4 protein [Thermodesulfobacteriota bacterium]|nr:glycosyltransferase family 4 protein [Thermodesulfobacteriota bacterium]
MVKSPGTTLENIAMLGSLPPLRALSSYCLELASAIADLGRFQFISFKKIYPALLYPGGDLRDDPTFPVQMHPNLKVKRRLTWYNPMTWIIEGVRTNGELLHAQWWSLPLSLIYMIICLGFKLRGKPVIFTVHNLLPHEKSTFYNVISRALFLLGDHFIVHSEPNRAQLIKYYHIPPEKVTRIPHGPLDFHAHRTMDRAMVLNEMGYNPEEKIILLFGAIRPYKGIHTALRALSEVVHAIPEASLLIAGKLWESWDPYQRLIDELGIGDHIKTFFKYIPSEDVYKFFTVSDLIILSYHHFDSQSGVGATAISFRKPMIVTNVGGLPELVADRRFVVPPGDPKALARTIEGCLKDPDQLARMAAGAEVVASKIAWPAIAIKTWSVYCKALGLNEISRSWPQGSGFTDPPLPSG